MEEVHVHVINSCLDGGDLHINSRLLNYLRTPILYQLSNTHHFIHPPTIMCLHKKSPGLLLIKFHLLFEFCGSFELTFCYWTVVCQLCFLFCFNFNGLGFGLACASTGGCLRWPFINIQHNHKVTDGYVLLGHKHYKHARTKYPFHKNFSLETCW